jgi:hypothetical protein
LWQTKRIRTWVVAEDEKTPNVVRARNKYMYLSDTIIDSGKFSMQLVYNCFG